MKIPSAVLTSTVLAFILACDLTSVSTPNTSESDDTMPTENILFQDDFSSPASGWSVESNEGLRLEYANGAFRIFVDNDAQPNAFANTFIERSFEDVRLEVNARQVSGEMNAKAALLCRRADENHYVIGDIDSTGMARISYFDGTLFDILGSEEGTDGLREGDNHLRMDCMGKVMTLYVNGKEVVTTEIEDAPAGGGVGFAAGRAPAGKTEFQFSNFVVFQP